MIPQWLVFTLISMFFAALTSILAKSGMSKVSADVALFVRTSFVWVFIILNYLSIKSSEKLTLLSRKDWIMLALSGFATAASWLFYYRAMKIGQVALIATIDKGSIILTIIFAYLFLKEPMTLRLFIGAGLIISGLLVLVWK